MGYMNWGPVGYGQGWDHPLLGPVIILVLVWSILWKGLALWRAAHRNEKWWFTAMLIINTLGILEIIYIFAITGAKLSDFTEHHRHHHS